MVPVDNLVGYRTHLSKTTGNKTVKSTHRNNSVFMFSGFGKTKIIPL